MKTRFLIGMMIVMMMSLSAMAKAKYVEPLTSNTPVGEVSRGGQRVLPVITWGGDYTEVHANGDSAVTAPNSIFGKAGLSFKLVREDDPRKQLDMYLSGQTPYLRGTMDMVNTMLPEMSADPRTKPVVFVLLTRSTGGDTLVVTSKIKTAADLKGKRIALQKYGPHMQFMYEMLQMAVIKLSEVTIVWEDTLSGPAEAMRKGKADAAFCIVPDALALTSGGGAEGSLAGSRILLTTKTYDKVIFDVYAVRSDFLATPEGKREVYALTQALLQSQDELVDIFKKKGTPAYNKAVKAFTDVVLGGEESVSVGEEMILDFTFARFSTNKSFFTGTQFPTFGKVTANVQKAFADYGLMSGTLPLADAGWDWDKMQKGAKLEVQAEAPVFNERAVAAVVTQRAAAGTLAEGQLFPTFRIHFKPNDNSVTEEMTQAYGRITGDLQKLGGAVVVIGGHADSSAYLKAQKVGVPSATLSQMRQQARTLSLQRADQVKGAIIAYASKSGVRLDESQFTTVGYGFEKPANGKMCGADPCYPASEKEWLENMRAEFQIIQLEAEASAWSPQ